MQNQKLTPLAPRAPLGHTQPKTQEFPPEPRRARPPAAGSQCFSGLSSGPGRGHFSLENGLSDTWIAKSSRCAHLRTWGSAPQDQETPYRTLTPVTLEAASPPSVARSGPPGPSRGRKAFCFCFLRRGPGPSEVAGGGPLTERSKTLAPACRGLPCLGNKLLIPPIISAQYHVETALYQMHIIIVSANVAIQRITQYQLFITNITILSCSVAVR